MRQDVKLVMKFQVNHINMNDHVVPIVVGDGNLCVLLDKDYCKMCEEMTANDVQQMAKAMLNGAYRIEITMLSEDE